MATRATGVGVPRQSAVQAWARRGHGDARVTFQPLWLLVLPIILLVAGLLAVVFWLSFLEGLPGTASAHLTLKNYVGLFGDSFAGTVILNTLGFAVTAVLVSLILGTMLAWLVERTDIRGKTVVYTAMSLGLVLPGFLVAMGWLFMLHPRIGIFNQAWERATGTTEPLLSITNVVGMGWVEGLSLTPMVFALTAASFRTMDPALEEAAMVHGARFFQVLRRVFLPIVNPSIVSAAIYVFAIAFASFDVPAIIGMSNRVFTFSTFVLLKSVGENGVPDYGSTATMSVLMVGIACLSSYWYVHVIKQASRYQVVTGKGYRPRRIPLGRWAIIAWTFVLAYLLLSKVIPLLVLLWSAGQQFLQPPSLQALQTLSFRNFQQIPGDLVLRGALNTAILMLCVPAITLVVGFAFSWLVVRSRSRFRGILDLVAFLPHAVPNIIFAVGAIFAALFLLKPIPLYGSLALIGIVYTVVRLSFATRVLNSALIQIHQELEEAAAVSGATGFQTARRVLAPLVLPALVNGWLWMALLTYRELTVATVLYSPSNITLPVVVWNFWQNGQLGVASAISVLLLACLLPLVMLYWALSHRHPAGAVSGID